MAIMTDDEFAAFQRNSERRTEELRAYLVRWDINPNDREGIVIPSNPNNPPYFIFDPE